MKKVAFLILVLVVGVIITQCGGSTDATMVSANSIDKTTNVAINSKFNYSFGQAIDPSTLSPTSFFLVPTLLTDISARSKALAIDPTECDPARRVGASVSNWFISRGALLTPSANLSEQTNYTICLTSDIMYANGSSFAGFQASFTTAGSAPSDAKDITAFSILGVAGTIGTDTVAVTVPFGTDPSALTPTITITGVSVSPASEVAQDFTGPVDYTVTAADASTKIYTVTVTVAPSDAKNITAFTITDQVGETVITKNTIAVTMPFGTDVTALEPEITITGVSVDPASGVATDFTDPVDYTVTAEDSSTKVYTVTVTEKTYALREVGPAGGWIFYINPSPTTWTYLEAAPVDQSTSIAWITGGATQTTANGNTSIAIGTGQANTTAMMAQTGYTGGAAKVCDDYSVAGYSDWFLPSKDEVEQMYVNLKAFDVGGLAVNWYWSSSESVATTAWSRLMVAGGMATNGKGYGGGYVRAIRAF